MSGGADEWRASRGGLWGAPLVSKPLVSNVLAFCILQQMHELQLRYSLQPGCDNGCKFIFIP